MPVESEKVRLCRHHDSINFCDFYFKTDLQEFYFQRFTQSRFIEIAKVQKIESDSQLVGSMENYVLSL